VILVSLICFLLVKAAGKDLNQPVLRMVGLGLWVSVWFRGGTRSRISGAIKEPFCAAWDFHISRGDVDCGDSSIGGQPVFDVIRLAWNFSCEDIRIRCAGMVGGEAAVGGHQ